MKILVTGSSGMFACRIIPALIADGHGIQRFDLTDGLDCRRDGEIDQYVRGMDVVLHLAAIPWGMPKYTAREYWDINVNGTVIAVNAAIRHSVPRFILASSTGYYGAQRGWPLGTEPLWTDNMNVVQRYGICTEPECMPDWDDAQRSRLHYMTSKVGAETALAARAIGGEIHGVVLRFAPVTPEPYEWGLWCPKSTAVAAVQHAIEMPQDRPFDVYNVGQKCDMLPELLSI